MTEKSSFSIQFFARTNVLLSERKRLKTFIARMLVIKGGKIGGTVNFIFCTDQELLSINEEYLNHDFFTDIITFELSDPHEPRIEADIYISVDRVRENARIFGEKVNIELHRVIFHGILHLCGFKDKTDQQKRTMRSQENTALKEYFR